jgi:hypothetical protein
MYLYSHCDCCKAAFAEPQEEGLCARCDAACSPFDEHNEVDVPEAE